jgi:two-component system sensor histidine kinase KdpD
MVTTSTAQEQAAHPARGWVAVVLLLAGATLGGVWLDAYVSLTSHAMLYVLVVVIAAYRLDWRQSAVCAVGAATALNFFFVPPRWTFEVESRENFIALAALLVVALVISHLAASLRRESRHAILNEQRARQLQALASSLADATAPEDMAALAQRALDAAFGGPNTLLLTADAHDLGGDTALLAGLTDAERDGLRCCMKESAVLGPGTGRWPGLEAWYLPLGDKAHVAGAACVRPARAEDNDGREHARTIATLLGQALWRVRLAAAAQAADIEAQRQQLQSTFLAAVSHDLRTPLAAIVGAASALQTQREKLSLPEQGRLLASIAGEAAYLSTLTENTLQLVRLTGSQQALQRDWESLEEIVGAVLARVRQRDPGRRIKSKVPADLPLIKADPVLLAQLISNLLDNALQYSEGAIDLSVSADARALVIAVKDRGPGIAPEEMDLIFEPYRRGDQSGQRGAGLGLALCRAIAVAHGGSLTVRQRGGGGCSFSATLPLAEAQPVPEVTP